MSVINYARLNKVTALQAGKDYTQPKKNAPFRGNAMQAINYILGNKWGEDVPCVCPTLSTIITQLNHQLPDKSRTNMLLTLLTKVIDTKGTNALEKKRALMVFEWMLSKFIPYCLRAAGGFYIHARYVANVASIETIGKALASKNMLINALKEVECTIAARTIHNGVISGIGGNKYQAINLGHAAFELKIAIEVIDTIINNFNTSENINWVEKVVQPVADTTTTVIINNA